MASRRQRTRCNKKNQNADLLDHLMRENFSRFLGLASLHSRRSQDADDALGDACVQFLLHFDGTAEEEARRWMLVVIRRSAWAIARQRRERHDVIEEVSVEQAEAGFGAGLAEDRRGPGELAEAGAEVDAFALIFARLKRDERRALILLAAGYTFDEIAAIEGWTYSKVKRCTYEGRLRLRRMVIEGGED